MSDGGPSIGELMASGAIHDSGGGVRSAEGVSPSGGGSMLPFEGKGIDFGHSGIGSVFGALNKSFEEAFAWMKAGASALGASISDVAGRIGNYLGTQEAGGDNFRLDGIGPSEVMNHGIGTHGDLQLKTASFRGSDGGQQVGG